MENVIIVVHLILALAIIGVVLIQRSEGGGLGIGGGSGGGMGGLMTPGGTASALTKVTALLGVCFFATSLTLAILAGAHSDSRGLLETYEVGAEKTSGTETDETSGTADESAITETTQEEQPAKKPSVPIGE